MEVMTLDETILYAEEVAEGEAKLCKQNDDASGYTRSHNEEIRTSYAKKCEKRSVEYHQIAEWLKDYKRLLERESCEDAINRQAVLEKLYEYFDPLEDGEDVCSADVYHEIKVLPSVKPVSCIAQFRFNEDKLKEIIKNELRTVFDTESYASEDGGDFIRYEDAIGMVEDLDFKQPKKTVGKLISVNVLDKISAEIEHLQIHKARFLTNDNRVCIDSQEVLDIIDKYKKESESKG